jgi:RNA polymerase sigma-70 factor (ECF subfamily)
MTDRHDDAFKSALVALIPQLRGFARSLTLSKDEADDLAQQALFKAWRAQRSFTPGTNLKAWVFTIARNQFYQDRLRARRQQPMTDADLEWLSSESGTLSAIDLNDLRKAMKLLPIEHREALALVCLAGLSYEEAASIARCRVGTMKSRLNRARTSLLRILETSVELPPDEVSAVDSLSALMSVANDHLAAKPANDAI